MQDADELLRVAADGGCVPLAPARAWHEVLVEAGRDLDSRPACGELRVDPAHHPGLALVHLEDAPHDLAPAVDAVDAAVAVRLPARDAPGEHRRLHAPERFLLEVREEHGAQQARHRELDLVDLALGGGDEAHPVEPELLADPADVLAVPRDAVQRLADDHVDAALPDVPEQAHEARSVPSVAGDLRVCVGADDGSAEPRDERLARRRLVGARRRVLLVRAVPRVDRGSDLGHSASAFDPRPRRARRATPRRVRPPHGTPPPKRKVQWRS